MTILAGALAGGVGAVCRFLLVGVVQRRTGSELPLGTAVVNLVGAFAIGLVAGGEAETTVVVMMVGFLGGFTTFSTWMAESFRLGLVPRPRGVAILNLSLTLLLGIALAAAGYYLGDLIT